MYPIKISTGPAAAWGNPAHKYIYIHIYICNIYIHKPKTKPVLTFAVRRFDSKEIPEIPSCLYTIPLTHTHPNVKFRIQKNLGEAEAEVLDFARHEILDLKVVLAAVLALVDWASVDLPVTLPMPVVPIRTLHIYIYIYICMYVCRYAWMYMVS